MISFSVIAHYSEQINVTARVEATEHVIIKSSITV